MWNAGTSAWLADRHPRNHEDAWTFKAALVCKPLPGTSIKASFGTAFRGPDTVDLFRTWASGSTVYAANPELVPERSRAFELSVLQTLGGFGEILKGTTLSASVFDNVMEDYIYRRTLDAAGVAAYNARYGTSFTSVRVYENLARARNYGAEASAEQALPYGAAIFASWTHNQTEVLRHEADPAAEGRRLPYVPRNQASLGVRWKTPLGDGLVLTGSVAGRYVEKVFMSDDNSDYAQHVFGTYEDFAVLDAKATLSFDGRASFSLWCDNALGEEYYQYYRAPGRSFGASVEFKY
jgi:iron complex outermembrane receptor protein